MRNINIVMLVLVLLMGSMTINAQDSEFEEFENATFGIEGIIPTAWNTTAPGVYTRAENATDITTLIVQSAPMPSDNLLELLQGQLGLETVPEAMSETETDFALWTVYNTEIEVGISVAITFAVAERDSTSYVVLLQSTPDEHEDLVNAIFNPVLMSIRPLSPDETPTAPAEDLPYQVEDVTFMSGDITLAGTLTIPEGDEEFPVVVLISGSGGQDRDESLAPLAEIRPFRDIADHLTRNGIAVLRYDDRGIAESEGDFAAANLYDFRDDAHAAIDYLAERDEFSMIGIAGHSEGGIYTPELAISNDNVDFAIGLAAPTVPMSEVLREQNRLLFSEAGMSAESVEAITDALDAINTAFQEGDDDAVEEAIVQLITAQTGREPNEATVQLALDQFTSPIFQSYYEYDPTPFWLALDVPTLAIYGSLDLQVSAEQNSAAIEGENDLITIVTIENMNHIFQSAETGLPDEYGRLEQSVNTELLDILTEWILDLSTE